MRFCIKRLQIPTTWAMWDKCLWAFSVCDLHSNAGLCGSLLCFNVPWLCSLEALHLTFTQVHFYLLGVWFFITSWLVFLTCLGLINVYVALSHSPIPCWLVLLVLCWTLFASTIACSFLFHVDFGCCLCLYALFSIACSCPHKLCFNWFSFSHLCWFYLWWFVSL